MNELDNNNTVGRANQSRLNTPSIAPSSDVLPASSGKTSTSEGKFHESLTQGTISSDSFSPSIGMEIGGAKLPTSLTQSTIGSDSDGIRGYFA